MKDTGTFSDLLRTGSRNFNGLLSTVVHVTDSSVQLELGGVGRPTLGWRLPLFVQSMRVI